MATDNRKSVIDAASSSLETYFPKPSTIESIPASKEPARTKTALLVQARPELAGGVQVPAGTDVLSFMNQSIIPGKDESLLEQQAKANLAREQIRVAKEAKVQAIGSIPDDKSHYRTTLVNEWAALSMWEQAPDEVLAGQADVNLALENTVFLETNRPIGDYGDFLEKMATVQLTAKQAAFAEGVRILNNQADETSVLDWSLTRDIGEMALLPMFRAGFLTDDLVDEQDQSWTDFLLPGTAKHKVAKQMLKDGFMKDPETARDVAIEAAEHLERVYGDKALWGISNDFDGWATNLEIVDSLKEQAEKDETVDWSRWTEDFFGVLSYMPIGGVSRSLYEIGKAGAAKAMMRSGYKGSYNHVLLRSVEDTNKMATEALLMGDANEGIRNLAISRKELVDSALPPPKEPGVPKDAATPARVLSDAALTNALISNAKAIELGSAPLPKPVWDVPGTLPEFMSRAQYQLKEFGKHIHLNKSQLGDVDYSAGTFQFRAMVGLDETSGFHSFGTALEAKNSWMMNNASIVKYDAATDAYVPVDAMTTASTARGEYFLVDDMTVHMGEQMSPFLSNTLKKDMWPITEWMGNWATTGMQRYTGEMQVVMNNLQRMEAAEQAKFKLVLKPYADLPADSRKRVGRLLYDNNGKKTFSPSELFDLGFNESEIVGYLAFRNSMDAVLAKTNTQLHNTALANGEKRLHIGGAPEGMQKDHLVKPMPHVDTALPAFKADKSLVIDGATGEKLDLSADDVFNRYINGQQLVRLSTPIIDDSGEEIVWAVVAPETAARLTAPPETMLKSIPGYMPKYIDHRYGVYVDVPVLRNGKAVTEVVDGRTVPKKTRKLLAVASDLKDADNWAASMQRGAKPGEVYTSTVLDDKASWIHADRSRFEAENLMFYQQRQDEVAVINDKLAYASPESALNRLTAALPMITGGKVLENYEKNWMRSYGALFKDMGGTFPRIRGALNTPVEYKDFLKSHLSYSAKAERGEFSEAQYLLERDRAIAAWDWYNNFIQGPTRLDTASAKFFGEKIGVGLARSSHSRLARGVGDFFVDTPDATKLMRSAAYFTQIASVPLKQWLINAPTLAMWMGKDPVNVTRALMVDGTYINAMYTLQGFGESAKSMNRLSQAIRNTHGALASDDYKALAKQFRERGVGEMHAISANLARNGFGDEAKTAIASTWQKGKTLVTELGPAPAERFVAATAFSLAARNYAKTTGKTIAKFSDDDWRTVVNDMSTFALNMTKVDSYNWQRGTFGMMMQYYAVRVKAVKSVVVDSNMTKWQKMGSFTAMASLFGAEGVGMKESVDFMVEKFGDWNLMAEQINAMQTGISVTGEQLRDYIHGAITDATVNAVLDDAFNEEGNDVNVAQSVSPFAGLDKTVWGFAAGLSAIISGDTEALGDVFLGPSATPASNFAKMANDVWVAVTDPALTTQEGLDRFVRNVIQIPSGGNNAVKAWEGYALKSMVGRSGDPIAEATLGQLFAQRAFGMSSDEVDDYYNAKWKLGEKGGKFQASEMEKLAYEHASFLFSSSDYDQFKGNFARLMQLKMAVQMSDPATAEAYARALDQQMNRRMDQDAMRFWKKMSDTIHKQKGTVDQEYLIGVLKNTDAMLKDPLKREELEVLERTIKMKKFQADVLKSQRGVE